MQLQSLSQEFAAAGIGIVALTYDAPALQQAFIDKFSITYPLLSDIDATSISNLGLLLTEHQPGDSGYGLPHPGIIVLDRTQTVVGKVFLEGYEKRVENAAVLGYAVEVLGGPP
ncbi:MAG: peroxiredoxin family protein [Gammaproteobacteria bacterium]|nr:peroxiredoxin family protein [Gammaproteobacteria bacterium]